MFQPIVSSLSKVTKLKKEEIEKLIEIPPSNELGDYAFPCFTLAKKFKKSPVEIAEELSKKTKSKNFEKIEAKGPYLNFFVDRKKFAEQTIKEIIKKKRKYGSQKLSKEKVMVEFSQPNTHKAFHVGHIRGTSLGESISRILEFNGNKVIRANYSGDTGMHIAKWLWCYKKFHSKEKLKEEESWIASIYVDAVQRLEKNPEFQEEVKEINKKLESRGDKDINELWKKTKNASANSWKKIYKELNTKFDVHYFESELEKPAKKLVVSLVEKKIAKISEGATIVDFKDFNLDNLGVLLLLRNDGTVLYGGKDISLAERKFNEFKLDKSYYIVGKEQDLHIRQVFKTFELMNSKAAGKSFYIPISEVRLPWGKMSSRTGDNVLYSDFRKELEDCAKDEIKKRHKLKEKEMGERALAIAIAAMKYTMLKQDLNKAIIFEKKEALSFDGNTGPYLLYTYARAKSILRKATRPKNKVQIPELDEKEKSLIFSLGKFPEIVQQAYHSLAPNLIANYTYTLAQEFNGFYHSHPVLKSKKQDFRLLLVEAFSVVLQNALSLLGINVLEKM